MEFVYAGVLVCVCVRERDCVRFACLFWLWNAALFSLHFPLHGVILVIQYLIIFSCWLRGLHVCVWAAPFSLKVASFKKVPRKSRAFRFHTIRTMVICFLRIDMQWIRPQCLNGKSSHIHVWTGRFLLCLIVSMWCNVRCRFAGNSI